ncbi:class I adenylate-forming enzyme family protein [Solirubrobacter soli]|uniref:class I adenylate-forming enzyme family protein n=1 Tax=Solirubrobacter soli TaxID=363832 RepID=UPI0003FAA74F|nr:AMP-binding protein [Solirubrobacter soli]
MGRLPLSACWTLPDHVDQAAERWPDLEALVYGDDRATFAGFAERTLTFAAALQARGIVHGDRVGVLMGNLLDTLVAIYGTSRLGAIPVPINNRFRATELEHVFGHSGMKLLITAAGTLHAEARKASDDLPAVVHGEPSWDAFLVGAGDVPNVLARQRRVAVADVAMLMYTSGTTAHPKGCRLTHEGLVRTGRVFGEDRFPMVAGDRQFNPLPLFHLATILPFNGCLAVGAAMIGMEHFEPGAALRLLREERCTVAFPAFTLIWQAMLDHPDFAAADLSGLRLVNVNGDPEVTRTFAPRTPDTVQISPYGATEGGGVIALSHPGDTLQERIGTAGRPFEGVEARIVDPETGAPVPPGVQGEITYRGWSLFAGYHEDPAATAAAIDADGYFHSGDLGRLDEQGRLSYDGRIKDMLKVGGENVAAAEIEGLLSRHPAVFTVQVVAAPDARYHEVPAAFVELRPGASATEQELIDHCLGAIATFKVPRYVRFVSEWPMSGTKIQKFVLREWIAGELRDAGITQAAKVPSARV